MHDKSSKLNVEKIEPKTIKWDSDKGSTQKNSATIILLIECKNNFLITMNYYIKYLKLPCPTGHSMLWIY